MFSALSLQVFCFISFARIFTSPVTIVFTGFGNQYFQLRLKLLFFWDSCWIFWGRSEMSCTAMDRSDPHHHNDPRCTNIFCSFIYRGIIIVMRVGAGVFSV